MALNYNGFSTLGKNHPQVRKWKEDQLHGEGSQNSYEFLVNQLGHNREDLGSNNKWANVANVPGSDGHDPATCFVIPDGGYSNEDIELEDGWLISSVVNEDRSLTTFASDTVAARNSGGVTYDNAVAISKDGGWGVARFGHQKGPSAPSSEEQLCYSHEVLKFFTFTVESDGSISTSSEDLSFYARSVGRDWNWASAPSASNTQTLYVNGTWRQFGVSEGFVAAVSNHNHPGIYSGSTGWASTIENHIVFKIKDLWDGSGWQTYQGGYYSPHRWMDQAYSDSVTIELSKKSNGHEIIACSDPGTSADSSYSRITFQECLHASNGKVNGWPIITLTKTQWEYMVDGTGTSKIWAHSGNNSLTFGHGPSFGDSDTYTFVLMPFQNDENSLSDNLPFAWASGTPWFLDGRLPDITDCFLLCPIIPPGSNYYNTTTGSTQVSDFWRAIPGTSLATSGVYSSGDSAIDLRESSNFSSGADVKSWLESEGINYAQPTDETTSSQDTTATGAKLFPRTNSILSGQTRGDWYLETVFCVSTGGNMQEADLREKIIVNDEKKTISGQIGADDNKIGTASSLTDDGSILAYSSESTSDPDSYSANNAGWVKVVEWNETSNVWEQIGSTLKGSAGDFFGRDVKINSDGTVLAVAAKKYVQVFDLTSDEWVQRGITLEIDELIKNEYTANLWDQDVGTYPPDLSSVNIESINLCKFGDNDTLVIGVPDAPSGLRTYDGRSATSVDADYHSSYSCRGALYLYKWDTIHKIGDNYIQGDAAWVPNGYSSNFSNPINGGGASLYNFVGSGEELGWKGKVAAAQNCLIVGNVTKDKYELSSVGKVCSSISDLGYPTTLVLSGLKLPDADGDGVSDARDEFDDDPNEWGDIDADGVGDNSDEFPKDPSESVDSDGDGVGDNADLFPNNPNRASGVDSDGDGIDDEFDDEDSGASSYNVGDVVTWSPPVGHSRYNANYPQSFEAHLETDNGDGTWIIFYDCNNNYPDDCYTENNASESDFSTSSSSTGPTGPTGSGSSENHPYWIYGDDGVNGQGYYYPVYLNDSGLGAHHTHQIDGVTYYMENSDANHAQSDLPEQVELRGDAANTDPSDPAFDWMTTNFCSSNFPSDTACSLLTENDLKAMRVDPLREISNGEYHVIKILNNHLYASTGTEVFQDDILYGQIYGGDRWIMYDPEYLSAAGTRGTDWEVMSFYWELTEATGPTGPTGSSEGGSSGVTTNAPHGTVENGVAYFYDGSKITFEPRSAALTGGYTVTIQSEKVWTQNTTDTAQYPRYAVILSNDTGPPAGSYSDYSGMPDTWHKVYLEYSEDDYNHYSYAIGAWSQNNGFQGYGPNDNSAQDNKWHFNLVSDSVNGGDNHNVQIGYGSGTDIDNYTPEAWPYGLDDGNYN